MLAAGLGGSGHPSLSAVLVFWASYPTLAGICLERLRDLIREEDIGRLFDALTRAGGIPENRAR